MKAERLGRRSVRVLLVLVMAVFDLAVSGLMAGGPVPAPPSAVVIVGVIVALVHWYASMFGWGGRLVATPHALLVRNVFIEHRIPWDRINGVGLDQGLGISLIDAGGGERTVRSLLFGSSMIGDLLGYPTYRRAVVWIEEHKSVFCAQGASNGPYVRAVRIPWISLLVIFLFCVSGVCFFASV
ncbi:PH domain-containing protein [Actinomadura atramentaria]|uniref:PH domain-containing protein n=1 Tax=Actinomadura atramentaria TaxID=1990 RepID=UPI0012F85DB8|nr:PH domain-containing protein [Actinomadura atramentaria]